MNVRRTFLPSFFVATLGFATNALADEGSARDEGNALEATPESPTLRPGFGARVGGYGFRGADGKWTDCRMKGVGVFGTLDFGKHAFLELGLDSYQFDKSSGSGEGDAMDRVSIFSSVAGGLRMFPDFIVTPYVQIGAGAEWTRVDVMGQRTSGVYPVGFIGAGGELNILRTLKAGAVLRVLGMAHPNHDDERSIVYTPPKPPTMEYQPVAQAQFYVRYAL